MDPITMYMYPIKRWLLYVILASSLSSSVTGYQCYRHDGAGTVRHVDCPIGCCCYSNKCSCCGYVNVRGIVGGVVCFLVVMGIISAIMSCWCCCPTNRGERLTSGDDCHSNYGTCSSNVPSIVISTEEDIQPNKEVILEVEEKDEELIVVDDVEEEVVEERVVEELVVLMEEERVVEEEEEKREMVIDVKGQGVTVALEDGVEDGETDQVVTVVCDKEDDDIEIRVLEDCNTEVDLRVKSMPDKEDDEHITIEIEDVTVRQEGHVDIVDIEDEMTVDLVSHHDVEVDLVKPQRGELPVDVSASEELIVDVSGPLEFDVKLSGVQEEVTVFVPGSQDVEVDIADPQDGDVDLLDLQEEMSFDVTGPHEVDFELPAIQEDITVDVSHPQEVDVDLVDPEGVDVDLLARQEKEENANGSDSRVSWPHAQLESQVSLDPAEMIQVAQAGDSEILNIDLDGISSGVSDSDPSSGAIINDETYTIREPGLVVEEEPSQPETGNNFDGENVQDLSGYNLSINQTGAVYSGGNDVTVRQTGTADTDDSISDTSDSQDSSEDSEDKRLKGIGDSLSGSSMD